MAVSKRLRYEIFRRDNHTCRYCGATAPDATLTIDHVTPEALGGNDDPGNLVTACSACNSGKSSVPPDAPLVADVAQDAMRWAAAIKEVTRAAMAERNAAIEVEKEVFAIFEAVEVPSYRGGGNASHYLPADWFESIARFIAVGLDALELVDAAVITTGARGVRYDNMWRYFCGVCWKKIDRRQEAARELLRAQEPVAQPKPKRADPEQIYACRVYFDLSDVCDGVTV